MRININNKGIQRILRWFFLPLLAALLFGAAAVQAEEENIFMIENGVLVSYTGTAEDVVVPQGVTRIGARAFWWNDTVKRVALPDTVREIDPYAFYYCTSLERVKLSNQLKRIGAFAFFPGDALEKVRIPKSVNEIGRNAFFETCTFVECYKNTAGAAFVKDWDSSSFRVLDAADISKLSIHMAEKELTYNGQRQYPRIRVRDGKRVLTAGEDYQIDFYDNTQVGTARAVVTMISGERGTYQGSETLQFEILPRSVRNFHSGPKTSEHTAELKWEKNEECDGYELWYYDDAVSRWKLLCRTTQTSYMHKNRSAETACRYIIRPYTEQGLHRVYAEEESRLTVFTLPDKKKLSANETLRSQRGAFQVDQADLKKTGIQSTSSSVWKNWSHVSPVSEFLDQNGNYCFAYVNGSSVYIQKYNAKLKPAGSVKLQKRYPQLGGIVCDKEGNYYIVWGKSGTKASGNMADIAVAKYTSSGKYVAAANFYSRKDAGKKGSADPQQLFWAGNCAIVLKGDVLICSYGRGMYSSRPSNEVISVNIRTMKPANDYSGFVSHSFNQSLLAADNGDVIFVSHGNGYPRGLGVRKWNEEGEIQTVPFHFYGASQDSYTGAQLGGIAETSGGYMMAAAAPREMNGKANKSGRDVFVQLLSKSDLTPMLKASVRKGTSRGVPREDRGIRWLTAYSGGYTASAVSVTAISRGRVAVMWEKLTKNNVFVDSYLMILGANGQVLQKMTSLGHRRLNLYEDPVYRGGSICWTSVSEENGTMQTFRLKIDTFLKLKSLGRVTGLSGSRRETSEAAAVALAWQPLGDADGYEVYYSTTRAGKYKKLAAFSRSSAARMQYSIKGKNAKKGYYKVRGFRQNGTGNIYGAFSSPVKVK